MTDVKHLKLLYKISMDEAMKATSEDITSLFLRQAERLDRQIKAVSGKRVAKKKGKKK